LPERGVDLDQAQQKQGGRIAYQLGNILTDQHAAA
jgi:hypothetical protein